MDNANWANPPGDIIGDLKKVTEKMQEVRERYANYTHIWCTQGAWDKITPHLEKIPYEQSQGLLYGLPVKVFKSFEDLCVALLTAPIAARILLVSLDINENLYSLSLAELMDKYSPLTKPQ